MRRLLGVSLLAVGILGLALGKPGPKPPPKGPPPGRPAPEINPTQAVSALALLSGGVLVLRRKR